MNLEEYNKMLGLVNHYSKRIHSWINNRSGVVEETEEKKSCFVPQTNTVFLDKESTKFTRGHEYGHAFWYQLKSSIDTSEFFEYAILLGDLSLKEMQEELSGMGTKKTLIPFTDFLSSMVEVPNGWYMHSKEYWDKCNHKEERARDEAFASMFGYLYEGNIFAFEKMQKYFPKFVDSCLNLIEKGLLA